MVSDNNVLKRFSHDAALFRAKADLLQQKVNAVERMVEKVKVYEMGSYQPVMEMEVEEES